MKIKSIETFCTQDVGFTCVKTDTGDEGWGQVSTYHADISVQVLHRQVAPYAIGAHFDDLGDLLDRIYEKEHKFPGSYMCRALCGLDTAIWDLWGKVKGKPVIELLGGTPHDIRVYGSSMRRDITAREELRRFARLRDQHGYDAFKFRVGSECGRDIDEWEGRSEQIVRTLSKGLDDQVALLVDANSCYSPQRAIELGKLLEDCGVSHFEEPCPYWQLEQTRQVTEALSIDVTGGEQDFYMPVWRQIINNHVVDIAQPDVCYIGGLTRALRVAHLAKQAGMPVTPHAANLSMVTVFTMHFLGALENAGKYLEFTIEDETYYPWQKDLFVNPPFEIKDGKASIPPEPGWGVTINPQWLEKASYRKSQCE